MEHDVEDEKKKVGMGEVPIRSLAVMQRQGMHSVHLPLLHWDSEWKEINITPTAMRIQATITNRMLRVVQIVEQVLLREMCRLSICQSTLELTMMGRPDHSAAIFNVFTNNVRWFLSRMKKGMCSLEPHVAWTKRLAVSVEPKAFLEHRSTNSMRHLCTLLNVVMTLPCHWNRLERQIQVSFRFVHDLSKNDSKFWEFRE